MIHNPWQTLTRCRPPVAKEQGLRSRAAFKLSQINRKFSILENIYSSPHALPKNPSHPVILDLCAAPGGWTQMVARSLLSAAPVSIVAVDILPIRPLTAHKNVVTLIGDITTGQCQAQMARTIRACAPHTTVPLVLHDGAPNVGADYAKDAYVQNELALSALQCATQHLALGGTFLTKVYRSRDYHAFSWTLQQLFHTVTAFKPTASRNTSAEIFLIAQGYKAPVKLDAKFLDPKHVFASLEETGGQNATVVGNSKTIFDKSWDKHVRKRSGYDMDHYDATMRHIEPVEKFVAAPMKEAIQLLSTCTGLSFHCDHCRRKKNPSQPSEASSPSENTCSCQFLLHHPYTTSEMKEHCADLRVLNKTDFKALFQWRTQMQNSMQDEAHESGSDAASSQASSHHDEEEVIEKEMSEMRLRRQRERKRKKKKEHEKLQKRRKQMAMAGNMLDMDISNNAQGTEQSIFSLATIPNAQALEKIREVNLDQVTDEELMIQHDASPADADMVIFGGGDGMAGDEEEDDSVQQRARQMRREEDLDAAYLQYLQTTKNKETLSGTKLAKRSKKLQRHKVMNEIQEDMEMVQDESHDVKAYAKLLQGGGAHDDSDDDDPSHEESDDDGFAAEPMTPTEFQDHSSSSNKNPLVHQFDIPESKSMKTARWFSNPLFASLGQSIAQATTLPVRTQDTHLDDSEAESNDDISVPSGPARKGKKASQKAKSHDAEDETLTADAVIASMPKTDKQIRHEKRLKMMERDERKKAKRLQKMGDTEQELQFVSAGEDNSDSENEDAATNGPALEHLSEKQKARVLEARQLIKAGLGSMAESADGNGKSSSTIELVPQESDDVRPLPIMDERKFDSEHEDYDSDDHAQTLALGTMMVRRSKEKAFVDASYNRYAWNDPSDLPEWFVDDENKHYRPQLPIPPALLAQMKEKMMALSAKPIAKVAEARARKNKRAKMKLVAAKKQAEAVANSSEMSEAMKLKAISKALSSGGGTKGDKKGKAYVVTKKGRGNVGGKGVKGAKVVDKRLKKEKRAMDRIGRTKKKGKQNGLTGSKKRRHHK
jgi:AdoMet-dependent rRNA methyltransferase SPB1